MKNENRLSGKNIVLGVCSSIAVYKAAELVSKLTKLGANVHVIMTKNAKEIISERIFSSLSRNAVACDMWKDVDEWKPEHISLAEKADILLVCPATANTIGNFANGLAPDLLSSTFLATKAKVAIAPAMNSNMYDHPATRRNIEILKSFGVKIIGPDVGMLACGVEGRGRLASVESIILGIEDML